MTRFRRSIFVVSLALVFYAWNASVTSAQRNVSAATLTGVVQDVTGAAVGGASVTVIKTSTNQTQTATSDTEGRFHFKYLPVGDYEVRTTKDGFEVVLQKLTAMVGQALELRTILRVETISAEVQVTNEASLIESSRTQIAETIVPEEVKRLPLNGRNFLDLALLLPGVSRTNTGSVQKFAETSAVPGTGISIAGQRNLNNSFIVDGSSGNDDSVELAGTYYSQEVIREFQVITNGAGAEFGRASSGFINIITHSGTNDFAGNLYGFLRSQKFDARNPVATSRDPLTQFQYGGSLGGPISRDRTFFFANAEQTRRHDSNIITISPSNVAAINIRLDAVGFPGPRLVTGLVGGGFTSTNLFGRVDHKLNASNDLAVTYNLYDIDAINARTVGGLNAVSRGTNLRNIDHTINTQNMMSFGSRYLNEFRFQFRSSKLAAPAIDQVGPAVNISGIAGFGTATSSPTRRDIDLYHLSDSVSGIFDDHSLKGGAEFIFNNLDIGFPGAIQGVYTFNNLTAFQNGIYSQYQQAFGAESQKQKNPNIGLFGQDEWKVRKNLTLNFGIRYDLQFLPDPIKTDVDNFSPRFGFAYSPDAKTVVRGSFGIYYDRIPTRATSNALQRDGSKYLIAVYPNRDAAGAPVFPNVLATQPSVLVTKPSITRIDPNIVNGDSQQASLQIERELPYQISASVGYLYLRGRHLILSRNVNVPSCTDPLLNLCRPDQNYGNVTRYEGSGDSTYNGMIVSINKRQGNWMSARLSYTLSKAIDDAGNFFFSTPQNNFDRRDDRGLSDNDQHHRLTISGTFNTPSASGSRLRQIFGGFQASWIFTYASRLPFNILLGNDRNGDTNNNDRPIGVGRNTGQGFDFSSFDLRLSRKFAFTEKANLELLVEGFNLFNHSNLSVPNNVFGQGTSPLPAFGRATAAFDPRQIQLGFRLTF